MMKYKPENELVWGISASIYIDTKLVLKKRIPIKANDPASETPRASVLSRLKPSWVFFSFFEFLSLPFGIEFR